MVVETRPEDIEGDDVLKMMHFQEQIEQNCWQQGNMKQTAPAQRMVDFVNKYFKNKKQQQKIHRNHNEWYKTHISSFDYLIYIFEDEEANFVAMTSYEILEDTAKINIYLNKDYRNKGYSQEILAESIDKFLNDNKNIK